MNANAERWDIRNGIVQDKKERGCEFVIRDKSDASLPWKSRTFHQDS